MELSLKKFLHRGLLALLCLSLLGLSSCKRTFHAQRSHAIGGGAIGGGGAARAVKGKGWFDPSGASLGGGGGSARGAPSLGAGSTGDLFGSRRSRSKAAASNSGFGASNTFSLGSSRRTSTRRSMFGESSMFEDSSPFGGSSRRRASRPIDTASPVQ
jgi:hypothetical protein